jgi:hypothetical protein
MERQANSVPAVRGGEIDARRDFQSIINIDAHVSHRALKLSMSKQQLDRPRIASDAAARPGPFIQRLRSTLIWTAAGSSFPAFSCWRAGDASLIYQRHHSAICQILKDTASNNPNLRETRKQLHDTPPHAYV